MHIFKCFANDVEKKKWCMCVGLFDILILKYFDYVDCKFVLRKGPENLMLGEELMIFDFEDFKSAYDYFYEVICQHGVGGEYCRCCQCKYLVPKWSDIVDMVSWNDYMEIKCQRK